MVLDMYFKGYNQEFTEIQEYDIPFFHNKVEFFPGEEINDFFIRCKNLSAVSNQQYLMNLAIVNMKFKQMSEYGDILSEVHIDNILFAPGKKPKCFPFFTNHSVRRTFQNSEIHLTLDRMIAGNKLREIQPLYQDILSSLSISNSIDRYQLFRDKFNTDLEKKVLEFSGFSFIPFEEKRELILIEWETENLVFDWFSALLKYQRKEELEVIIGESKYHKTEKYGSENSTTISINTGWILRKEIPLITDLLQSRLCFITIGKERIKAYPIGKKKRIRR